jgi:alpha-beta hydrolase superfamily lysophospholipase
MELLIIVERVEAEADVIRAEARREASEILNAAEVSAAMAARASDEANRALAAETFEDARLESLEEVKSRLLMEAERRAALRKSAESKMKYAASVIYTKIVGGKG